MLGFAAYGLSIFSCIRAQKELSAARTSAYYALAPFTGAFLSFVLLHNPLHLQFFIGLFFMLIGTFFVTSDSMSAKTTLLEQSWTNDIF